MAKMASYLFCLVGSLLASEAISMDSTRGLVDYNVYEHLQLLQFTKKIVCPNATIVEIKTLLAQEVDLEKCSTQAGEDVYECGRRYRGRSPVASAEKNQHYGNKAVVDFVFGEMLYKKLEKVAAQHK